MTFAEAWKALLAVWFPGDVFQPTERVRRYYEVKWQVAQECRATRVMEIGVRAGYSAFIFCHANPEVRYLGIDNGMCDFEARLNYLAHAEKILAGFDAMIWRIDTSSLRTFPWAPRGVNGQYWDLVHIDGHHSMEGCLHDLRNASAVAQRMLVDDYDTGAEIKAACSEFLASVLEKVWVAKPYPDDGLAGNLLLTNSVGGRNYSKMVDDARREARERK